MAQPLSMLYPGFFNLSGRPSPDGGLMGGGLLSHSGQGSGAFSGAPSAAAVQPPPPAQPDSNSGGWLDSLFGGRGSSVEPNYGLAALGQGIATGNVGGAFQDYAAPLAQQRQVNMTRDYLVRRGVDPQDAAVVARDPSLMAQIFRAPQFTEIGTDVWGNKRYGFVDPYRGTVTPADASGAANGVSPGLSGGATGASMPGTGPSGATGDEFLKTIPPELQATVRKLANYQIDPRSLAMRGGLKEKLIAWAAQYDPSYDQAQYPARQASIKEFTSGGSSSPAATITAGNTALQHLLHLYDLSKDLGGVNSAGPLNMPLNMGHNAWDALTQDPNRNAYNTHLSNVAEEATKFYRSSGGNESDIQRRLNDMSLNNSPAAREAAMKALVEDMYSKVNALQHRWQTAMGDSGWRQSLGQMPGNFPLIQKEAQDAYDKIMGNQPDASGQGSGQGGQNSQSAGNVDLSKAAHPQTQADFNALPSGTLYIDPDDNQPYTKP